MMRTDRFQERQPMQKLFALITLGGALVLVGCAHREPDPRYRESILSDLPFVYRMTVQQGNLVTEEMIDQLQPGMTKMQVRYLLGTPMLVDLFHTNRWYYTYTIQRGHAPMEKRPLVVYFEGDALARIAGYLQPDPQRAAMREPQALIVSVPDWQGKPGFLKRALDFIGLREK